MPELPEVETIRRQLEPRLLDRRIVAARAHPSAKFAPATGAVGATFGGVGRRGKYLIVALRDDRDLGDRDPGDPEPGDRDPGDRELVVHLGMTGSLAIVASMDRDPPASDPYERAAWDLDDGTSLVFRDVRRFGRIAVVAAGDHSTLPTLAGLGPEPFSDDFTPESLWRAVKPSRRRLKTLLLGQRVVAGVGNIYADEALWAARLHPAARRLTRAGAERLHRAIIDALTAGLQHGGTTLRDYVDADGNSGANQHRLNCYGRAGRPCPRCGAILRRSVVDARSSVWCPRCQQR